ncbi:hypothetical protein JL100_010310 [Skermanella mucosa]|uniref:hypothetical protein n=1 Tax=Skermanella mucosa TaxID=1789672 RepID=UPI001E2D0E62|nr:hypothetical protein [Skermanella mucosa]UEM23107.1 hypothetical protein JL100_010310 [Skermanella mucosa]
MACWFHILIATRQPAVALAPIGVESYSRPEICRSGYPSGKIEVLALQEALTLQVGFERQDLWSEARHVDDHLLLPPGSVEADLDRQTVAVPVDDLPGDRCGIERL